MLPGLGLDQRRRTAANAAFATGYALTFRGNSNWFSARGFRYGFASAAAVSTGYLVALAIPSVRARLGSFAGRGPEVSTAEWVAVHIPIGTVYSEETIFRSTLDPLLGNAFGARGGTLLGALTFGLWHITPARAAGDSIPGTVAATTAGGLAFGWLRRRTSSTTAPALLHYAINAGGVLASRAAGDAASSPESEDRSTSTPQVLGS